MVEKQAICMLKINCYRSRQCP